MKSLDTREEVNGIPYSSQAAVDEDGSFSLALDLVDEGDFRVCVSPEGGASYVELAAGPSVELKASLCADLVALRPGEARRHVVVTPVTTWVTAVTDAYMRSGFDAADAHALSVSSVESWLDCLGVGAISTVLPYKPNEHDSGFAELDASLLLYTLTGGLSDVAVRASRREGADEGILLYNSSELVEAIRLDLLDGTLDNKSPTGDISIGGQISWSVESFLQDIVASVHRFLLSKHNQIAFDPELLRQNLQCLSSSVLIDEKTRRQQIRQPESPVVRITSPADGDVLTADQEVVAEATAGEALVSMDIVSRDAAGRELTVSSTFEPDDPDDTSVARGILAIDRFEDGQSIDVLARAATDVGYSGEDAIRLVVNRHAPELTLEIDGVAATGSTIRVQGLAHFRGEAFDASGVASISLTAPALGTVDGTGDVVEFDADTTPWPEGSNKITLAATDAHGERAQISADLLVDNRSNGTAEATVSLGAPVRDAYTTVRELTSGLELGTAFTNEYGCVSVELADTSVDYDGYIEIVVRDGTGTDLIDGGDLQLRQGDVLRAVVPYQPSADGTVLAGISVNMLTTCAASLADLHIRTGKRATLRDNIAYAYHLFADHLSRAQSPFGELDARYTVPSDMTMDWSQDPLFERRLGLAHAGAAWDAAAHVHRAGRDHREYGLLDHIRRLCGQDLLSGHLSGIDVDGASVMTVGAEMLNPHSFRYDTALGIFRWLDGVLPDGTAFDANQTRLRGADFAQVGGAAGSATAGFLHTISSTINDLFASDASPQAFDADVPSLRVWAATTIVNDPNVTLTIEADDGAHGTGVALLSFVVDGVVVDQLSPVSSGEITHDITIPCNRENVHVQVVATDGVGLAATEELYFSCDNRIPAGGFSESFYSPESCLNATYVNDGSAYEYEWSLEESYDLVPSDAAEANPIIIIKYWDRLHRTSENLPIIRAWFSDTLQGGFVTQNPKLVVTYEYLIQRAHSGELEAVEPARPLAYPGDGGSYEVPISYETLSPDLRLTHPADRHVIRFRARDSVGNIAELDYGFHLILRSAPAWYGACGLTDELISKDLESDSTHLISSSGMDLMKALVSYPAHSNALTRPLHVTVANASSFEMTPAELRWERWLYPRGEIDAWPACFNDDFHVYWTMDRQIRGAQYCDSDHFGNGPNINDVVDRPGPYAALYNWLLQTTPISRFVDDAGVVLPQDPTSLSTFLLPVGTTGTRLLVNAGSVNTTLNGEAYAWEQYQLELGDGSDIETQRYYFADGYINVSNTRTGITDYEHSYVYLSKLRGSARFPQLQESHPELPYVVIPVTFHSDCESLVWEWDERIGNRW